MAIPSSGNISIKSAAGSGRSIDAENTAVSSGSLVALSTSAIEGLSTLNESPYAMSEFYSYQHTLPKWSSTGTVSVVPSGGKVDDHLSLTLSDMTPDNPAGTITAILSYPGGSGLRIIWSTLVTGWTSLEIGASSSSFTTINRSSFTEYLGNRHILVSGSYITYSAGASMYFAFNV